MNFEITASPDQDILIVTFTGRSTKDNARAMTKRYFEILRESDPRKVLADIRSLEGRLSPGDTYFLVRDLPVNPLPAGIRTAVLEAKDKLEYADFLETTSVNAGVALRCFVDRAEAISWLRTS
jgi:hypothetical protein